MGRSRGLCVAIATTVGLALGACEGVVDSPGYRLFGLTDNNELVAFTAEAPNLARVIPIGGTSAPIVGIDFRLSRDLYGLASDGSIYRLDTATGAARRTAAARQPLPAAPQVVDFDPHFDGLRVIDANGRNIRVNVDNGQVFVEAPIAYGPGDRNVGKKPDLTAGAYINTYPGSFATQLFAFDSANGTFVIQDPPESGRLATIGSYGMPSGKSIDAFDVITDVEYEYQGFAVVGSALYRVNLGRGTLTKIGDVGIDAGRKLIDIAVVPKVYPRPPKPGGGYE